MFVKVFELALNLNKQKIEAFQIWLWQVIISR